MAVQILNGFDENVIYSCFQNIILEFKSDITTGTVNSAQIFTFDNPIVLQAIPSKDSFWIDLQSHIKSQLIKDNLFDQVSLIADENDLQSFIHDVSLEYFISKFIPIKIFFDNGNEDSLNIDFKGYRGVKNLFQKTHFNNEISVAHPDYILYWKGLPFDITITGKNNNFLVKNVTFSNPSNQILLEPNQIRPNSAFRVTLDDGVFSIKPNTPSGNDLINESLTTLYSEFDNITEELIKIERITSYCFGVYIKWLNQKGGWSYYLFEDYNHLSNSKSLKSINNDFDNFGSNSSPEIQIGKKSNFEIRAVALKTDQLRRTILKDLIDSPKVYFFKGEPNQQSSQLDWIEVKVKTTNFDLKRNNSNKWDVFFDLEFPKSYTQTI